MPTVKEEFSKQIYSEADVEKERQLRLRAPNVTSSTKTEDKKNYYLTTISTAVS